MAILTNETWAKTINDVDYVFFRTSIPLGMKKACGFLKDHAGGCNRVSDGGMVFCHEFDSLPEQADVEAKFPLESS